MASFIVQGGVPLKGEVSVSGSKNAALPILAATLLTNEECVVRNVPDIEDVHTMLELLREFGSEAEFSGHTVRIQTRRIRADSLKGGMRHDLACRMRASVLLLGPLLARAGSVRLPYPGGCVLGVRPVDTHLSVLAAFGVKKEKSAPDEILLKGKPKAADIVMPELSVTATENAVMASALNEGESIIRSAAMEPHVQDLCRFLVKMGVEIGGIGTHTLVIRGKKKLRGVSHTITPDYLETGTFVLAAALTRGDVTVRGIVPHDLDAVWYLLREMGLKFQFYNGDSKEIARDSRERGGKVSVRIFSSASLAACRRLQTNAFPGFPTDLQPPFVVLLTQAKGESRIHETLFEGRFAYVQDLIRMGAKIEKLNPHELVVRGPVKLRGGEVKSWDIRAGAAMILAGLASRGKTMVRDIHYIDRGYEGFDEKLRGLGAIIERG